MEAGVFCSVLGVAAMRRSTRVEGTAAVGAGFDGAEGLALAVETMEEPVAEACGTDGPDLVAGEAQSSRSWSSLGLLRVAE